MDSGSSGQRLTIVLYKNKGRESFIVRLSSKMGLLLKLAAVIGLIVALAACGGNSGGHSGGTSGQPANSSGSTGGGSQAGSSGTSGGGSQSGSAPAKDPYYAGKTIEIIIGYAPGGGADIEGRLFAKYLPKYIPGNPKIKVTNLPGGAGIAAANVLYNEAKPDGLTLGLMRSAWISSAIMKDPSVQFDVTKFDWVGASGSGDVVIIASARSGINHFNDLKDRPADSVLFGAWSRTAAPYVWPMVLKEEVAPSIKPVTGYSGANDVILAMERGEVHAGAVAQSAVKEEDVEAGRYKIIAASGALDFGPEVVKVEDLVSPEGLAIMRLVYAPALGAPIVAPPNTDPEALEILREAFAQVVKDPEFLKECEEQSIFINPMYHEDIVKLVEEMAATPQSVLEKLQQMTQE